MIDAVVRFWWVIVPATVARVFRSTASTIADGIELAGAPPIAAVAPLAAIVAGFACARLLVHGYDSIYTGSLSAMGVMLALGCLGGGIGAWAMVGFIAGDATSGRYFNLLQSHFAFFALAISYALLTALVVSVPRAARLIAQVSLPKQWNVAASVLSVLLAGGFAYLWSQAAPVLIRPYYTFANGFPDSAQIAPVQQHGYVLAMVAVIAMALAEWLRFVLTPKSQAIARESFAARARVKTISVPWYVVGAMQAAAMTLFLAGAFLSAFDWVAMFVILAVAYAVSYGLGRVELYARIMGKIPFALRFLAAMAAGFVLAWAIVLPMYGSTDTYAPLLYTAAAGLIVFAVLFPKARRAVAMIALAFVASWPAAALADNCNGLGDCFSAGEWAVIAAAAIVAVVAGGFIIAAAAGAAEAAAAAGVAAEAAGAAETAAAAAEAAGAAEAAAAAAEAGGAAEAAAAAAEAGEAAAAAGEAGEAAAAAAEAGEAGEAAAAAGEAGEAGGVGPMSDLGLPDVNAVGGVDNCAQCAQAVENALGGEGLPGYAADIGPTDATMGDLAAENGANWSGDTSLGDIGNYLQGAGDGSRGIVYVAEGDSAHVFNAVNQGGNIIAIDGQTGVYGSLGDVAGYSGYGNPSTVLFLPTFP